MPLGFKFATIQAGFRKENRPELALLVSDFPAVIAGMFTQSAFPAAPVLVGKEIIKNNSTVRGVMINSGQANACTGEQGLQNCYKTLQLVTQELDLQASDILPASTGVIGAQFKMELWEQAIPKLVKNLGQQTVLDFAKAIMTTDAFPKLMEEEIQLSTGTVKIAAVAKGAGMICPNMATMLAMVICDAQVEAKLWQEICAEAIEHSFNRVTVDGDTSTNDTLYALSNGASKVILDASNRDVFQAALTAALQKLAYMLVQDGEGATKVLKITVSGANSEADANQVARTVAHSPLVKTAMYGRDANWGRIIAAVGRSGVSFDPMQVSLNICGVQLFEKGQPTDLDFDTLLAKPMAGRDLSLDITLGTGSGCYTVWASDLGHAYIDCNASYRS